MVIELTARLPGLEDPQPLLAVTRILPFVEPAVTIIVEVVDEPDHPDGSVQVYPVAPFTGGIRKVLRLPEQTTGKPNIFPGLLGAVPLVATARDTVGVVPQKLLALTDIFPPVAPAVAIIGVVDELPVHPDGKVQV